jgi:hypothetical protein
MAEGLESRMGVAGALKEDMFDSMLGGGGGGGGGEGSGWACACAQGHVVGSVALGQNRVE